MNRANAKRLLQAFDFRRLFIEELGWDRYATPLTVQVDGQAMTLQPVAHKRGMVALVHNAEGIPLHAARRQIERQVARSHQEHLIVYVDGQKREQVWQWVRREPGKPLASREHRYQAGQPGDSLVQKLEVIAFGLDEEDGLTLVDVTGRARAAFDVERVTRRFYDLFKRERDAFEQFLTGIPDAGLARWYVSVMLNRLMFVYFIQKKGFLDGDPDYLAHKLAESRQRGADRYYRDFLGPLFFEGLARPAAQRPPEAAQVLGNVPYLNGGIFQPHEVEQRHGRSIRLPDAAFERLFAFFDRYQWHLDDRPLRRDDEINPDVLGYIFEKYINQKEMGAYYTKEDITGYISRNAILPYLLDEARKHARRAFESEGGGVWHLLSDDPDRYIYRDMRHGAAEPLRPDIAAGLDDVAQRGLWNQAAPEPYSLPTEIWRETVTRRLRYEEVRAKLAAGEVRDANDLVTYNLDIEQFVQDAIETCEDSELLRAFWKAVTTVSVLDLTCGSGAFLFAGLNVLEPVYEACLERMAAFVAEAGPGAGPLKYADFRRVLERLAQHPNRKYFVYKSIVVDNLYGVDIMAEAVEIAKLRLFLKLVAQVESADQVEPLPDIDFNIRAGNTLVGFATYQEVERAVRQEGEQLKLALFDDPMAAIEAKAQDVDRLYQEFRRQQTELGGEVTPADKQELRQRLDALAGELDRYLGKEYGVDVDRPMDYQLWRQSHQPFHWFVEFYGIMRAGGFGVIVGNPPWIEYSAVRNSYQVRGYRTLSSGNLYGICTERALSLRAPGGSVSFIVQLPLVRSPRMAEVRKLLVEQSACLLVAPFDDRPGKLFEGLEHCRSVIFLSRGMRGSTTRRQFTTRYQRWPSANRAQLLAKLEYVPMGTNQGSSDQFPKYSNSAHVALLEKVTTVGKQQLGLLCSTQPTSHFVFYQEAMQYWAKAVVGLPYYAKNGVVGEPAHGRYVYFPSSEAAYAACALLNSSLFYLYFVTYGDCFHLNHAMVTSFPIPNGLLGDSCLVEAGKRLADDLKANAETASIQTKDGDIIAYGVYYGSRSKPVIDEIDRLLAGRYGLTDEELDFVVNYDIKFRMGDELMDDEGGEE